MPRERPVSATEQFVTMSGSEGRNALQSLDGGSEHLGVALPLREQGAGPFFGPDSPPVRPQDRLEQGVVVWNHESD